jgi:hypothetical protein
MSAYYFYPDSRCLLSLPLFHGGCQKKREYIMSLLKLGAGIFLFIFVLAIIFIALGEIEKKMWDKAPDETISATLIGTHEIPQPNKNKPPIFSNAKIVSNIYKTVWVCKYGKFYCWEKTVYDFCIKQNKKRYNLIIKKRKKRINVIATIEGATS